MRAAQLIDRVVDGEDARRVAALAEGRPIPLDMTQVRVIAAQAVRALLKKLGALDPRTPIYKQKARFGKFATLATTQVSGEPVSIPVKWVPTQAGSGPRPPGGRRFVVGGMMSGTVKPEEPKKPAVPQFIELNINTSVTPQDCGDNLRQVHEEVFAVLIHEVTHARDRILQDDPVTAQVKRSGAEPIRKLYYYNDPSEVRAYMQQVVDEVVRFYQKNARLGGPKEVGTDLVQKALATSHTWQRIRLYLRPENRKLVLKAVVRALSDRYPQLAIKYPRETP